MNMKVKQKAIIDCKVTSSTIIHIVFLNNFLYQRALHVCNIIVTGGIKGEAPPKCDLHTVAYILLRAAYLLLKTFYLWVSLLFAFGI